MQEVGGLHCFTCSHHSGSDKVLENWIKCKIRLKQSHNKVKEAFRKPIRNEQLKIDLTPIKKLLYLGWIGIGWIRTEGFRNSPLICLDHLEIIIRRTAQLQHRHRLHGSLIQPSTTMLEGKKKALMESLTVYIKSDSFVLFFKDIDIWTFKFKIAHNNLHDSAWSQYLTILICDFIIVDCWGFSNSPHIKWLFGGEYWEYFQTIALQFAQCFFDWRIFQEGLSSYCKALVL